MQFLLIIILLAISATVASVWGSKKRIGFGWSFFFIFFLAVIPGLIAVAVSPSLKNIKPYNKKEKWSDITLGIISILMVLGALRKLLFTPSYMKELEGREGQDIYLIGIAIAFSGLAYYMFSREKRNNMLYDALNPIENMEEPK